MCNKLSIHFNKILAGAEESDINARTKRGGRTRKKSGLERSSLSLSLSLSLAKEEKLHSGSSLALHFKQLIRIPRWKQVREREREREGESEGASFSAGNLIST